MFRNFSVLFFMALAGALNAQSAWSDIAEQSIPKAGERLIIPQVYRTVSLDLKVLQPLLAAAPERFTPAAGKNELPVITLPMPDGSMSSFRLTESPVMAPGLQAKYPEIRTYTGHGIDDPTALLKCDLTPRGFHAMVLSAIQNTVFIDPYSTGDRDHYVVYFKKDYQAPKNGQPFACESGISDAKEILLNGTAAKLQGDCQLRKYRLALACTGEYAAFQGGTKALALAAMNTTMNRVNGVYENDLAITMQIVNNNDLLIYLNGASDPYSNGNGGSMLNENQSNCTTVIGSSNFDIGHVFGTNTGGIAGVGVVCSNNGKGRGVTGSEAPTGDPFDIDYVAHEMGHQFGGDHTFNGTTGSCSGNSNTSTAIEPGSGSTIMAYAGICDAQDIQPNSDDYFHAISIQQINTYTISGTGNSCAVKTASGNNNPTVDGGADYIIPKSTPFALTATGSDPNGDALTYCWEQIDAAISTSPPVSTSTTGPLFRSFKGTASPTRYFPRLSDLVNNTNYAWEKLPSVARTMKFRVLLRDNHDGAGCTDEDDVQVTVAATAGPFTVTEPNTNVLWLVGEPKTVTWDVSNTDQAPVSCSNVRILLSTDGGYTYPVVLAANVPNNGSANVVVPNNLSSTCRVKVEAVGNIFFDISNQNFRIELPPVPTFTLLANPNSIQACAGDTLVFTATVGSILNFTDPVQLAVSGTPAGATVQVDPNPVVPGNNASVTLTGLTPAMAGAYSLGLQGTSGVIVQNSGVQLSLLPGAPGATAAAGPPDGAAGLPLAVTLLWNSVQYADKYYVEVATSPSFSAGSLVYSQMVNSDNVQIPALQSGSVYYWRVRAENLCGKSDFSTTNAFQTGNLTCNQTFSSTDIPKTIASNSSNSVTSVLNIPADKTIADVNVSLQATHTYVGDLNARLVTPNGATIMLFDRPGFPATTFGCSGNNFDLVMDDDAALDAAALESSCSNPPPALNGIYQPIDPLSVMNGLSAQGNWSLIVGDNSAQDGGSLNAWGLTFCFADLIPAGALTTNLPLIVGAGTTGNIPNSNLALSLSGNAGQGVFTLLTLSQHGVLVLNGDTLQTGDTFTQAGIDAGLLAYSHNGDAATDDEFLFDAFDQNNYAWLHNTVFHIVIVQNNLAATAEQTQAIVCHNGATGEITVAASGLDGQYQYSLNGGPNQSSNVFSGLPAGTYTLVVTGQFGFTATSNAVTLNDAAAIQVGAAVVDDDVTITTTGGSGALEYSLDGANFQPDNVFQNLANGFYTVTVRDANGCTGTGQFVVAVNTLIANLTVQNEVSCHNGADGAITVLAAGGEAPYAYSLNGGAFQPENAFTGLPPGVYSVEVKDNQGFNAFTNEVTITAPPAISVSASANLNAITVAASGGTGALEYSLDGASFQTGNTFGGLANGDYTVTVRDANGCTATASATVAVPPLTIVSIQVLAPVLCHGGLTSMEVSATGGIPPYEYALDNGAFQSDPVFNGVDAGLHTCKVRDASGSIQSADFDLQEPSQLLAGATVTGNDVQFEAGGGTPPYTFAFNGPNPPVNLPNGNYTFTVTDASGCTAEGSFTVNIPPLALTGEILGIDLCNAEAVINLTASGGEPPYEYSLNGGPFQDSPVFTVFPGPNSVRVRDAAGTIVQIPVPIQLNPPVQLDAAVSTDTVFAEAQFGTPPYVFSVNGLPYQSSPVFPGVPNGDAVVVVLDANGCSDTAFVIVTAVAEPGAAWGLAVYPNPSAGTFRLSMRDAPPVLQADVFDATGRNLRSLRLDSPGGVFNTTLELQDLPQGAYLLRLNDGKNQSVLRLSIVR